MRFIFGTACMLCVCSVHASFDHYRVTDLGLPLGSRTPSYLLPGNFTSGGRASARFYAKSTSGQVDHYQWSPSGFQQIKIGSVPYDPYLGFATDSDWFGIGNPSDAYKYSNASFYQNGSFHEVKPEAGWLWTSVNGASETKYLAGAESNESSPDGTWRAMLYNVQTGNKTFLPQIGQNTYAMDAFDDGTAIVTATVNADKFLAHGFLWKNGQYTHIGPWVPLAMSKTGYIAGSWAGDSSHNISIWHDGVNYDFVDAPISQQVTGVSDAGIVSCFASPFNVESAYLASITGVAKLNDLVVNLPNGMNIYGATINASGHMFGQALVGNEHHFVLLDPVPEPATFVALAIGAAALLRNRRKH